MKRNLAGWDRAVRVIGACGFAGCAIFAPLPVAARMGVFAVSGVYLLLTAVFGTCVGYSLMGKSTCEAPKP